MIFNLTTSSITRFPVKYLTDNNSMMTRKATQHMEYEESPVLARLEAKMDNMMRTQNEERQFMRSTIMELKDIIAKQQTEIKDLKTNIVKLETRIEDLEQYTRKEDIIITGLKIKKPLSQVVQGESGDSIDSEGRNRVEEQVLEQLAERGVSIEEDEISACHTLGRQQEDGTQKVIIRFMSLKSKVNVMRSTKKLRGTKIFINEHLTKKNAGIARAARELRRNGKIESTWVKDCKVFIKVNGQHQQVRDAAELSRF